MAFGCTFDPESDEFFDWLMRNGYPELGALSRTIQGDTDAKDWLMEHGFPHLAAIDSAIDKEAKAEECEQMLEDQEHQCITSPLQIIDILRSERNAQRQAV